MHFLRRGPGAGALAFISMNCAPATIAATPVTKRLEAEVRRLATTPRTTISIVGEAGVGKQAWARRLHAESARRDAPFVVLEVGEPLTEAVFARAAGGTLFLREVSRLGADDQALLMARFGEDAPEAPRILAASRTPSGLREDLEYRLNVLVLEVPPLRERLGELGLLAQHLAVRQARELGQVAPGLGPDAEAALVARTWPGNLHELAWCLRGALVGRLGGDANGPFHADEMHLIGQKGVDMVSSRPESLSLDSLEEDAVRRALEASSGNRSLAARRLGIHRTTLYHKLRRFGLG